MAKQRIHSFGGRSHSTPFLRYDNANVYTERKISVMYSSLSGVGASTGNLSSIAYWATSGTLSGTQNLQFSNERLSLSGEIVVEGNLSATNVYVTGPITASDQAASKAYVDSFGGGGTTITGSTSGVLWLSGSATVSSDSSFTYNHSASALSVVSASVSSMQLHREDYAYVDNNSLLRNGGGKTPIWDVPYYAAGLYKQIWIQKEINATGTNFRYLGIEYSDIEHLRKVTTHNSGGYSFVMHWANYGASIMYAGMRTVVGAKRFTYKQITTPIRTASSTTNQRIWIGIADNVAIRGYDQPASYNAIAFRYISASANWCAYHCNGATVSIADTGIPYTVDTNHVMRIEIYGITSNFFIDGEHVATLSTNTPSDTQDMYVINMITNTSGSTSTKELGIAHVHLVMS